LPYQPIPIFGRCLTDQPPNSDIILELIRHHTEQPISLPPITTSSKNVNHEVKQHIRGKMCSEHGKQITDSLASFELKMFPLLQPGNGPLSIAFQEHNEEGFYRLSAPVLKEVIQAKEFII
jgi:hypothetical protein